MGSADEKELHIHYDIEFQRKVALDDCDGVEIGSLRVHSKGDVDAVVLFFRSLGFRVKVERWTRATLVNEFKEEDVA